MRPGYRAGQFFKAVRASISDEEASLVRQALPLALQPLFFRMTVNDQRHGMDVYQTLYNAELRDDDLLTAALLHDCGRALGRIGLWQRVALVLMKAGLPSMLERMPFAKEGRWRHAFYIQREHARLGADLAAEAGAPEGVVAYIRWHEGEGPAPTPDAALLQALRQADSIN